MILEWEISYVKVGRAVLIPIEEVERIIPKGYRPPLELKSEDISFLNRAGPT